MHSKNPEQSAECRVLTIVEGQGVLFVEAVGADLIEKHDGTKEMISPVRSPCMASFRLRLRVPECLVGRSMTVDQRFGCAATAVARHGPDFRGGGVRRALQDAVHS